MHRLESESLIWMTTVRPDGTPQASLVWFLWRGDHLLVYSRDSARVRNVAANPRVALNFNNNRTGGAVATFTALATRNDRVPPVFAHADYLAKYADDIARIGHTPESFSEAYPVPIEVAPTSVRAWGN